MKFKIHIILLILCGVSLTIAMHNGVRVVDAQSFNEALMVGTKEVIEKWAQDNKIGLNTRCIRVAHHMGFITYMYPIQYVLYVQMSTQTLRRCLVTLIALDVPIDGYDDFNPLLNMLGSNKSLENINVLYNLGADPSKRVEAYYDRPWTPQEYVVWLLKVEKAQSNKNIIRIELLEKIHELFVVPTQQRKNSPINSPSSTVLPMLTEATIVPVPQPAITNIAQQPNHNIAAQNTGDMAQPTAGAPIAQNHTIHRTDQQQTPNTQQSKSIFFPGQHIAVVAVASVLCGIGLKMAYDWYFGQQDCDDVAEALA